jgi:hypothetical protein
MLPPKIVISRRNDTMRLALTPKTSSASAAYGHLQLTNLFDARRFKGIEKKAKIQFCVSVAGSFSLSHTQSFALLV